MHTAVSPLLLTTKQLQKSRLPANVTKGLLEAPSAVPAGLLDPWLLDLRVTFMDSQ